MRWLPVDALISPPQGPTPTGWVCRWPSPAICRTTSPARPDEVVLGLVDEGSKSRGTDHCLGLAKGAGLEVFRFAWGTPAAKDEETKGEAA